MHIKILAIGKTKRGFILDGLNEYLGRLKHYTKLEWIEIPDVKNTKLGIEELKNTEADFFLAKLSPSDKLILLDELGKHYTSEDFANYINKMQITSTNLVFCIGGAFGFAPRMYERADVKLSLSYMTFSHQMIRMLFAEQLYRAFTIIKGEKYHHR